MLGPIGITDQVTSSRILLAFEALQKIGFYSQSINPNPVSSPNQTGEAYAFKWAIKKILRKDYELVVFDIGAHVGEWTNLANDIISNSKLHIFEPVPQSFDVFKKRIVASKGNRIFANNVSIGNKDGEENLYIPKAGAPLSHASSIIENVSVLQQHEYSVQISPVRCLETYLAEHKIPNIDYLKIDTEGSELTILNSMTSKTLSSINFLQFEFNDTLSTQRLCFKDFWNLLCEDFHVFRICVDGVIHIFEYILDQLELFLMSNYLCINKRLDSPIIDDFIRKKAGGFIEYGFVPQIGI